MKEPRRRRAERQEQYESDAYRALLRRFTANLRRIREARAWTQEEAGARCGMVMQMYQRIESAGVNVTLTTVTRLSAGFEVDAHELFAPIDAPPPRDAQ
ncbi:MAG: helix-turn-helix transcriptional regulator [Polyangiales bacterium]